jgi:hypothetical protein
MVIRRACSCGQEHARPFTLVRHRTGKTALLLSAAVCERVSDPMYDDTPRSALLSYLSTGDPTFAGKVAEMRKEIRGWLQYTPATFGHYTRHTIEHSDEIITQLSKLQFEDDDPKSRQ